MKAVSNVFGDGVNDVEVFCMVGHGIATANAVQQLKRIAEEVTLSVEKDGVAAYINVELVNRQKNRGCDEKHILCCVIQDLKGSSFFLFHL